MTQRHVSLDEAVEAVTGAHSAVWHAIAGHRYVTDVHDEGSPFQLTIYGDHIVSKPFPGLGIDWLYTVYPERLKERAYDVVKHTARQAIIDASDAVWGYGASNGLKALYSAEPTVVLLRALRLAYAHRADNWDFGKALLPLQWRQLRLTSGMDGKSVSETIFLSDQLFLLNDAIFLLDPQSPLVAAVHR
jgi:hypothetical protein